ncbi:hypothetical protein [Pseudomonas sp. NMS19W]|uniref:hypothetical protein n=1 Tax=Pseudomonas sp. NMS19W TaxID=3079768 RepID=UPI003F655A26
MKRIQIFWQTEKYLSRQNAAHRDLQARCDHPPLASGVAAAYWTPLAFWFDMKEGLIAFLGFLCAAVVQVMPITANFLQSDQLNPSEAERLTRSLTKQQHYWIALLSCSILAMLIIIISSAMKTRLDGLTQEWHGLTYSSIPCFLIASTTCFVMVKMLGLFEGMLSLHHLRGELVVNAAKRSAGIKMKAVPSAGKVNKALPENYGQILPPRQ